MKEYIITLKNREDLDAFYEDMETEGGSLYIPHRRVECHCRRPMSRNTHYMLTDEEADQIKRDPRVAFVERNPVDLGLVVRPAYTQTSTQWSRSLSNILSGDLNHGLLRIFEGSNRSGWNGVGTQRVTGTIETARSGKDVDVVILDGDLDKNHPEFAVNLDGTGGTRMVEYNWYSLNSVVDPGNPATQYNYNLFNSAECFHGHHVAGIAVGNTQGAAKDANIYNLNPYSEKGISLLLLFDYIRAFHDAKLVNPETGVKNPTVVNASIGVWTTVTLSDISAIQYRGGVYNSPFTDQDLKDFGIADKSVYPSQTTLDVPGYSPSIQADIQDMIDDGVIFIVSAGNSNLKIDVSSGLDFDNIVQVTGPVSYYYNRGGIPNLPEISILAGSSTFVMSSNESRATYSNTGSGVDVFAPGDYVVSSTLSGDPGVTANDFRNSNYKIVQKSGTSMSSPQVCGVVACLLEKYKTWAQADVRSWIQNNSKTGQLDQTVNGTDLNGAANRYFYFNQSEISRRVNLIYTKNNAIVNTFSQAAWGVNTSFTSTDFNLAVYSFDVFSNGKIIVGGQFTTVNGVARGGLAMINPDGTVDTSFSLTCDARVEVVKILPDNKILIGGSFTTVGGITRNYIARINSDGTVDTTFNANINFSASFPFVRTIEVLPDTSILISGRFFTLSGFNRRHIAKLNSDGSLITSFNANVGAVSFGTVYSFAVLPDTSIVICGYFPTVGGVTRNNIAKIDSNGALISSFGDLNPTGGLPSYIYYVKALLDGSVLVSGNYTTIGGISRNLVSKISTDGVVDASYDYNSNGLINHVQFLSDNTMLFGGGFTSLLGENRGCLARLNSDNTLNGTIYPACNGSVTITRVLSDGTILVGGDFTMVGGGATGRLANLKQIPSSLGIVTKSELIAI